MWAVVVGIGYLLTGFISDAGFLQIDDWLIKYFYVPLIVPCFFMLDFLENVTRHLLFALKVKRVSDEMSEADFGEDGFMCGPVGVYMDTGRSREFPFIVVAGIHNGRLGFYFPYLGWFLVKRHSFVEMSIENIPRPNEEDDLTAVTKLKLDGKDAELTFELFPWIVLLRVVANRGQGC